MLYSQKSPWPTTLNANVHNIEWSQQKIVWNFIGFWGFFFFFLLFCFDIVRVFSFKTVWLFNVRRKTFLSGGHIHISICLYLENLEWANKIRCKILDSKIGCQVIECLTHGQNQSYIGTPTNSIIYSPVEFHFSKKFHANFTEPKKISRQLYCPLTNCERLKVDSIKFVQHSFCTAIRWGFEMQKIFTIFVW